MKCHSAQIKLVGTRTCLSLPVCLYRKELSIHKQCNKSLRINVNEDLLKFNDPALIEDFLAEVDSFKKRNCGNDVLVEIQSVY